MVTKKTIAHGTNKDPKRLARLSEAMALSNVDNVDRIVYDLEEQKKTLSQMKETLNKERGEGQNLKRKHADILSEIEKSKEACQILQFDKDPLILSVNIMEGEKKDLEKQVEEAEYKGDATNKKIEEL